MSDFDRRNTDALPTIPKVIAALPVNRDEWEMAEHQRSVAVALCEQLSDPQAGMPETVAQKLLKSGAMSPEVFALIEEGLVRTFIEVRRMMVTASDVPDMREQLRDAAVRRIFEYFESVRDTVQAVLTLSDDVAHSLHLLAVIMSSRGLSDISAEKLREALSSIDVLLSAERRVFSELVARWADEVRTEGMNVQMSAEPPMLKGQQNMIEVRYQEVKDIGPLADRARSALGSIPGFVVNVHIGRESRGAGGGEAHYTDDGWLQITFTRISAPSTPKS